MITQKRIFNTTTHTPTHTRPPNTPYALTHSQTHRKPTKLNHIRMYPQLQIPNVSTRQLSKFVTNVFCFISYCVHNNKNDPYRIIHFNDIIRRPSHFFLFLKTGSKGSGLGQLKSPKGLAIDHRGWVHVADYGNRRVQVRILKV